MPRGGKRKGREVNRVRNPVWRSMKSKEMRLRDRAMCERYGDGSTLRQCLRKRMWRGRSNSNFLSAFFTSSFFSASSGLGAAGATSAMPRGEGARLLRV